MGQFGRPRCRRGASSHRPEGSPLRRTAAVTPPAQSSSGPPRSAPRTPAPPPPPPRPRHRRRRGPRVGVALLVLVKTPRAADGRAPRLFCEFCRCSPPPPASATATVAASARAASGPGAFASGAPCGGASPAPRLVERVAVAACDELAAVVGGGVPAERRSFDTTPKWVRIRGSRCCGAGCGLGRCRPRTVWEPLAPELRRRDAGGILLLLLLLLKLRARERSANDESLGLL